MLSRIPFFPAVAVALVALAGLPLSAAQDKVHEATVVKAGDRKITVFFKGDGKKHTCDVAKDAKITLDAKKAKLEDLKEGCHVEVVMDDKNVLHKIDAQTAGAGEYVLTVEGMT